MILRSLLYSREQADAFVAKFEDLELRVHAMPLKSLPKGMHWHVSKPGERGSLELTWNAGELTFEVRSNRQGDWQEAAVDTLINAKD